MTSSVSKNCTICCETFNKSTRARINCPGCSLQACRTCIRTYLLGSSALPHCMQCKNRWERDFLIAATLKSFVNGEYHVHRSNLLLDQEKSRLPETMPLVENYLKVGAEKKKRAELRIRLKELRAVMGAARQAEYMCTRNINRYSNGEGGEAKKTEFKRACPVDGCLGFLSTQWKCGVCNIWTCPTCMEIKGAHKDEPHECDPNTVESVKLLKKDTKNCPSCAAMIYKISGCDQMWCTQCHIAFSWRTGRQVNGVIHNPHFYQWQNDGGGGGHVNAPGADVCGGIPNVYTLRNLWYRLGISRTQLNGHHGKNYLTHIDQCIVQLSNITTAAVGGGDGAAPDNYFEPVAGAAAAGGFSAAATMVMGGVGNFMMRMHRAMTHFSQVNLRNIRHKCQNVGNNTDLRIKYAVKEITEEKLKAQVARRDKTHQKSTAILHIFELINTVLIESFRDIVQSFPTFDDDGCAGGSTEAKIDWGKCILRNFKRCNEVRLYANKELVKISVMYHQCVFGLRGSFYLGDSHKYTTVDLKNNTGIVF